MAGQFIDEYAHNTIRHGCLHCGSPRRPTERLYQFDQLVDEILDLDGNTHAASVAVICETCMVELGGLVGCATPKQAAGLRSRIETLGDKITELEAALGTREALMDSLSRLHELTGDMAPSA